MLKSQKMHHHLYYFISARITSQAQNREQFNNCMFVVNTL